MIFRVIYFKDLPESTLHPGWQKPHFSLRCCPTLFCSALCLWRWSRAFPACLLQWFVWDCSPQGSIFLAYLFLACGSWGGGRAPDQPFCFLSQASMFNESSLLGGTRRGSACGSYAVRHFLWFPNFLPCAAWSRVAHWTLVQLLERTNGGPREGTLSNLNSLLS